MRLSIAIAITLVSVAAFAAPAVKSPLDVPAPLDPRVATTRLLGVVAMDQSAGAFVAVGAWGKIITSRDAGKTWSQSAVPLSSDLLAVNFPTPQKGWAAGHDGVILHSADGGKHWQRQLDGRQYGTLMVSYYEKLASAGGPRMARALQDAEHFKSDGSDKPFLDVWFENEHSGWAVGAFNLIMKTGDGGKTWEPWIDRTENENAYSMFAIGNAGNDVFIVGELGLVLRLDRKKMQFVRVTSPYSGSFFGLAGKPGTVVIYGLRGNAFRSNDSGKTWQKLDTGISGGITGGTFLGDGRLVLVSADGDLLLSANDGNSFTMLRNRSMPLNGVAASMGDTVLVVGERGTHVENLDQLQK